MNFNEIQDKASYKKSFQTLNNMTSESIISHTNESSYNIKKSQYNLNDVLNNSNEFEMFKLFMQSNNSFFDLQCFLDIESYM
jgi:hypothetical protein